MRSTSTCSTACTSSRGGRSRSRVTRPRRPFGGGTFIADTSAWVHARKARVRGSFTAAIREGQIATCPIVNMELLYSTRDAAAYDELAASLAQLRDIPITRSVTNAALRAQRELGHARPLFHRSVKLPDLLIAAAAADAALGVLHYDEDYDTLATVLNFESRLVAPRGSV
jgi:predicted nucleic acid-binding protein